MKTWFVYKDGRQYGPFSDEEVVTWARSGYLNPDDLVWHDAMTTWQPALHIPGLFASFSDDQLPPVPTASVRHRTQQGDHREGRFRWHLLASVLITAVVLIVVGIVFTQTKEAALALWTWIFVVLILLVGIGVPLRVLLRNPRPAS